MKRLLLLCLASAIATLIPPQLHAQDVLPDLLGGDDENTSQADSADGPQRIGIPAASFELEPNESGAVAGYCFDEHLIAPTRVTTFQHVLAGDDAATVSTTDGRRRSLRDAIYRGDIAIKAHQLNVMFINRTDQPMSVQLARPAVLWDRSAGAVNPLAFRALEAPTHSFEARQKAIWKVTNAERRLHALGYLKGSIYSYNPVRLRAAMNEFQREQDIAQTTELDATTVERIRQADEAMRNRLRALGFESREGRFARENLGSQIRAFEKFLGQNPVGRWSTELGSSLAATEALVAQLNTVRPLKGQQIASVLNDANVGVATYLTTPQGLMVLTDAASGVELWSRAGRSYKFSSRGEDAVRRMDEAAAALAQRASKDSRAVIYAGVSDNGMTNVTVGDRSVDVSSRELDQFVNGGAIPRTLGDALASVVPQATNSEWTGSAASKTLVVYRSPLQQGRAPASLSRLGLEMVDGSKLAGALDRVCGNRASIYVSDDLRSGAQRYDRSTGSLRNRVRETGLSLAD